VVGTVWRPPDSSVGLLVLFLVLLVGVEWLARRLNTTKLAEAAEIMDETILQQMVRSKTAEGLDRLEGTFCVEFQPEEMTATVHIPFCPTFESIPKVQVHPVDETNAATLRITSLKTFGMRIDVKRNNATINRLRFAVIAAAQDPAM